MKNFALALVAATAISGANAEIGSGLYLGANASMNFLSGDVTVKNATTTNTIDMGRDRFGLGMYLGYGMVSGCMYYAGEMGYQFENSSFRFNTASPAVRGKFKIDHSFNLAMRVGYKFTPATVGYIRLGADWNRMKLNANVARLSDSKSRVSFVPGLGLETSIARNWVGRMEWTYDLGRTFKRADPASVTFDADRVHTQSVRLGLAYKF